MNTTLRTVSSGELKDFLLACETAFGWDLRAEDVEHARHLLEPERAHAAFDGDRICGTAGAFSFLLSVPGARVPAAGVTMVAVLPSHRRRGVLTSMMRAQLEDVRERAEPVAILWASESNIYGRFGYGIASIQSFIDLERDRARFQGNVAPRGRARLVDHKEALDVLPPVYDAVFERTPGMCGRTREWWEHHRLRDEEHQRDGGSPLYRAIWEDGAGARAYAIYRVHSDWKAGHPAGRVQAFEVMGADPEATREIWRFVCGIDLVTRIRGYSQPLDHPLLYLLDEPRRLRASIADALWLRIVDVAAALESRSYDADGALTIELEDEFCPWNAGRWAMTVSEGQAKVEATKAPADLRMNARELGSVYLGGLTFGGWARGGRIEELTEGAVERADRMFRSHITPWNPEIF